MGQAMTEFSTDTFVIFMLSKKAKKSLEIYEIFRIFLKSTWNAGVLHESAAVLGDEPQIDGERRFVVDDAADAMHAVNVQLLRLLTVDVVLREQLRDVVVIDLVKLSFGRERHENYLRGWKSFGHYFYCTKVLRWVVRKFYEDLKRLRIY